MKKRLIIYKRFRGQITIFLALCSSIIITVILAEIETARYVSIVMMQRNAVMIACESMLAQYNIPLYEMYSIFGVDGNGRDLCKDMEKIVFANSSSGLFKAQISGVCITDLCSLTDEAYKPLVKEIIQYMKTAGFLNSADDILSKFSNQQLNNIQSNKNMINQQITKNESASENQKAEYEKNQIKQSDLGGNTDSSSVQVDDPRKTLTQILNAGLLSALLPSDFNLSSAAFSNGGSYEVYNHKAMDFTSSQSVRNYMNQISSIGTNLLQNKSQDILIFLYADQKFKNALDVQSVKYDTALMYELEYMICGHQSDRTNLLDVLNRLMIIRTIINFSYLLTDSIKTSSAHSMAVSIASATLMPWLEPVVYILLLVAWAYGEAMMDLRVLMDGGKVPFMKNQSNWKLSLDGIAQLAVNQTSSTGSQSETGLAYEDYLLILWLMASQPKKMQRMTHLMEANINLLDKNSFFSMHDCFYSVGCITEFSIVPLFSKFTGLIYSKKQIYQWSECY